MPALASSPAAIEIFWIPEGSGQVDFGSCQGTSHQIPGAPGIWTDLIDLSVQAKLADPTVQGIAGAVLYVEGLESLPQGSIRYAEPNFGAVVTFGSPVQPYTDLDGVLTRRAGIAWAGNSTTVDCQTGTRVGDSRYVQLYTLSLIAPRQYLPQDLVLRVVGGEPAVFPGLDCPTLILCDYPVFTAFCVAGGEFIVNPVSQSCTRGSGTTPVVMSTWGKVKGLYRSTR